MRYKTLIILHPHRMLDSNASSRVIHFLGALPLISPRMQVTFYIVLLLWTWNWGLYGLLGDNQEQLEVAKSMHAPVATSPIADFHGRALRQKHAEPGLIEFDRRIGNVEMLTLQMDLR